jgi:hypothetical protein
VSVGARSPLVFSLGWCSGTVLVFALMRFQACQDAGVRVRSQAELERLETTLVLGMTQSQANGVLGGADRALTSVATAGSSWLVATPPEPLEKHWVLLLEFDGQERLAAIRYRTADGPRPSGVKPDRLLDASKAPSSP